MEIGADTPLILKAIEPLAATYSSVPVLVDNVDQDASVVLILGNDDGAGNASDVGQRFGRLTVCPDDDRVQLVVFPGGSVRVDVPRSEMTKLNVYEGRSESDLIH